jgi:hypothetical protein
MSANGISTLSTKEARQKAKLDLAALKREGYTLNADGSVASGPSTSKIFYRSRNDYDLSQLPTQYYGNTVINNNNAGGLVTGRPWIAGTQTKLYADGLYGRVYTGYFNDVPTWFATATQSSASAVTSLVIPTFPSTTSLQLLGYFLPRTTETYTFYTNSDDASWLWIGNNAVSGFTTANATVNNGGLHGAVEQSGTVNLTAGIYYPIRIQYGNGPSSGLLTVSFSTPSIAKTSTFTDLIFYNTTNNGL